MDATIAVNRNAPSAKCPGWVLPQKTHLIGACGSGMRAMADFLAQSGTILTGSDSSPWAFSAENQSIPGLQLLKGHRPEHLTADVELVIYSDAIPPDNAELAKARSLGIPTRSYFDMLGQWSGTCPTVAIAGTHGKSTVTAMATHVLRRAGRDPSVFCGATPLGAVSGGHAGRDPLLVVEACEYRANFLKLRPSRAAILGIEPDHFDYYKTTEQLEMAFRQFAESVPADGFLLVRHDCPIASRVADDLACRVESFGLLPEADWSARIRSERQGRFEFEILRLGRAFCTVGLKVPGRHNVLNALAAAALAWQTGVTAEAIAQGLDGFAGLHRRLEILPDWNGVALVDDYAHHPTEVSAALAAVRRMYPGRRVWCVFQPHQALRTARLMPELAASLQNTDQLVVAEIFRAREGAWQAGEATAADLAQAAGRLGVHVQPARKADEILKLLGTHLAPGDVLVTLGAGDIACMRPA